MADEEDDGGDEGISADGEHFRRGMLYAPDRGRIIIVNFELGGGGIGQEMRKSARPCVVVQNNKLRRGRLVTVVPLSGKEPVPLVPAIHHRMDHRSFRNMPNEYGGQAKPRWAKCDYVDTVSLERCTDPYSKPRGNMRKYVRVSVIKADIDAIDARVQWALGIKKETAS